MNTNIPPIDISTIPMMVLMSAMMKADDDDLSSGGGFGKISPGYVMHFHLAAAATTMMTSLKLKNGGEIHCLLHHITASFSDGRTCTTRSALFYTSCQLVYMVYMDNVRGRHHSFKRFTANERGM